MSDMQLYLGLDLSPEYTQLSYYNTDTHEPESVYHKEAKDTYMLPNVMFYSAYHKKLGDGQDGCYRFIDLSGWCVGAKASACRFEENGVVVDRIYQRTLKGEHVDVGGRSYKAGELLVKLMVLHIKQFTDDIGAFVIKKLTVTVADTDLRLIQAVRGLRTALRLSEDEFSIVSHMDSGLCYIFAQPEPLRNNSVGLFDFGREGLNFYRIDLTRKYPLIVRTEHVNYGDRLSMKRFGRSFEDMDEAFADIVKDAMSQVFISSVFLTGVGFADNWMKQSAALLCQGRRVFVGQNIYTKGACYRALGGVYTESLERYFIDTEHTVKTNIGINLMDEKRTFWPIAFGGSEWFNTRGRAEVFPDETRRIQMVYQDILSEDKWSETIEIHGLPARPRKTTKLSIEIEYYGADKGAIVIRDMGFGCLYPTTNKIYRKEFDIGHIKRKNAVKLETVSGASDVAEGDTDELKGDAEPVDVQKPPQTKEQIALAELVAESSDYEEQSDGYEVENGGDCIKDIKLEKADYEYGGHGDDMSSRTETDETADLSGDDSVKQTDTDKG